MENSVFENVLKKIQRMSESGTSLRIPKATVQRRLYENNRNATTCFSG